MIKSLADTPRLDIPSGHFKFQVECLGRLFDLETIKDKRTTRIIVDYKKNHADMVFDSRIKLDYNFFEKIFEFSRDFEKICEKYPKLLNNIIF